MRAAASPSRSLGRLCNFGCVRRGGRPRHVCFRPTGNAIRVPTPNVSLVILNLTLEKAGTEDEVREFLRSAALHSSLQRQIDFTTSPEIVSSDLVGNRHACIVDGEAIIAKDNRVVLYVWYDNEFGYACQVVRVAQKLSGIRYPLIPEDVVKMGF